MFPANRMILTRQRDVVVASSDSAVRPKPEGHRSGTQDLQPQRGMGTSEVNVRQLAWTETQAQRMSFTPRLLALHFSQSLHSNASHRNHITFVEA